MENVYKILTLVLSSTNPIVEPFKVCEITDMNHLCRGEVSLQFGENVTVW